MSPSFSRCARRFAVVGPDQAGGGREGPAPAGAKGDRWLLLAYRVPSEPSRLRASIWRRLKTLGAVYLLNGAAVLPESPPARRALHRLRSEIVEEMGGFAVLLGCGPLAGGEDIAAIFNAARDDEYEEIVDRCNDFVAGVAKEISADHFTFAELEENEEDLTKLKGWLEKVRARDVMGSAGLESAVAAIERCGAVLEDYAERVYQREGV